jgi:hypothetical protein
VEIAEFVKARLDEDEAAAKLAAREGGTWKQDDPDRHPGTISSLGGPVVYDEGSPDEYQAPHIARHDPARVLREVAAKRAILAEVRSVQKLTDLTGGKPDRYRDWILRQLAAVWSGHPDYRAEWKP